MAWSAELMPSFESTSSYGPGCSGTTEWKAEGSQQLAMFPGSSCSPWGHLTLAFWFSRCIHAHVRILSILRANHWIRHVFCIGWIVPYSYCLHFYSCQWIRNQTTRRPRDCRVADAVPAEKEWPLGIEYSLCGVGFFREVGRWDVLEEGFWLICLDSRGFRV